MPYSDYSYLNPIHIVWRKGTEDDPYIDRVEYLKVSKQKIVLSEIPDKFTRVKISGMVEINYDEPLKKVIHQNQFSVNYSTGVIQFHSFLEAKSVNVIYKGRGFIQYPSSRIYHQDEFNNVVESLEDIINNSKSIITDAQSKISDYEIMRDNVSNVIVEAQSATTEALNAKESASKATEKALDAYETTRLVFLPYVNNEAEISTLYPNPNIGWTVQVYETGIRYRWDGNNWIPIDLFGGGIPTANEDFDGLLSKEDYSKLRKIDEETYSKRVLVFILPSIEMGVQPIIARFPFKGKIVGVKALCGTKGVGDTLLSVETSLDMTNWQRISDYNITILDDQHFDDGTGDYSEIEVMENTLFRLNVLSMGANIQNITLEVMIETII